MCSRNGFFIRQIDIKNAYLNGTIEGNVYIEVPKYVKAAKGMVCQLRKLIYGLKESALIWNKEIDGVLKKINFKRSTSDFCLYVLRREKEQVCYLLIYIDNIILGSNNENLIDEVLLLLKNSFKLRVLETPAKFLGMCFRYCGKEVFLLNNTR